MLAQHVAGLVAVTLAFSCTARAREATAVMGASLPAAPERSAGAAVQGAKTHEDPAYGNGRSEGHSFAWLGNDIWGADVLAFLRWHCRG